MGDVHTITGKPVASSIPPRGPLIALFIDIDNTNLNPNNLTELLSILRTKGSIVFAKIYGYGDDKVQAFEELVAEHRLETAGKMRFKPNDASVVDTRLVVDCLRLTEQHKFNKVFIWAGQGDMISLFSKLRELGTQVLTIDNSLFDCDNKFVDEKIRIFSPYSLKNAEEPPKISSSSSQKTATPKSISLDGENIPVLPRKEGAPEFGKGAASTSQENTENNENTIDEEEPKEMTAEENEELLNRLISFYGNYMAEENKKESEKKPDYLMDFGELDGSAKTDDDYFSVSPSSGDGSPATVARPAISPPTPISTSPTAHPAVPPPASLSAPIAPTPLSSSPIVSPAKPVHAPRPLPAKTITIPATSSVPGIKLKPLPVIPTKASKPAAPVVSTIKASPSYDMSPPPSRPAASPFVMMDEDGESEKMPSKDFDYFTEQDEEVAEKLVDMLGGTTEFTSFEDPNKPTFPTATSSDK